MSFDLIKTIQQISLDVIDEHASKVMFGKVTKIDPLTINVGNRFTLTEELIVLDSPVEENEPVIIMKSSMGNKYLVLSTIEKVYKESVNIGGTDVEYSTSGTWKSLGTFKITHYCCEKYPHICNAGYPYKTASGTTPHVGGCAVDPTKIPLGSYVKVNGKVYHAEDTGGAIKGNRLDIVVGTHNEALSKGAYSAEVFLKVGD